MQPTDPTQPPPSPPAAGAGAPAPAPPPVPAPPPAPGPYQGMPPQGPPHAGPPPGFQPGGPGFQPGGPGFQPGGPGFQPGGPARPVPPKKGMPTGVVIGIVVALVAVLAICGSVGVAGYFLYQSADEASSSPADSSDGSSDDGGEIDGLVDYRTTSPASLTKNHRTGRITYPQSPPVGGDHNGSWQNCEGDVYTEQIPSEHAVHSLEHGAVWLTYDPSLSQDDVAELAGKIRGRNYTMMSPYPGLDAKVSLQAWGYQLKADSADDADIDRFIAKYARTATQEPGATCGSGVTITGSEPR